LALWVEKAFVPASVEHQVGAARDYYDVACASPPVFTGSM